MATTNIKTIGFFSMVQALWQSKNIHQWAKKLSTEHQARNLRAQIPFSNRYIYLLQDKVQVRKIMAIDADLPYVNNNYNLSHGHWFSINAVNTSDKLWKDLHQALLKICNKLDIASLMQKHQNILFADPTFNFNQRFEDFWLKVWSEACFGEIDLKDFKQLREQELNYIKTTFHDNAFNRLPFIGNLSTRVLAYQNKDQIKNIDSQIQSFVEQGIKQQQGIFYQLYQQLKGDYANALQITCDNAFLGILVYDFVYGVLLDYYCQLFKDPNVDHREQFQKSLSTAFLFPFRFRTLTQDKGEFHQGDFCLVNLKEAGLHFSFGKRRCAGAQLFMKMHHAMEDLMADKDISFVNREEEIVYSKDPDVPLMQSQHQVTMKCSV